MYTISTIIKQLIVLLVSIAISTISIYIYIYSIVFDIEPKNQCTVFFIEHFLVSMIAKSAQDPFDLFYMDYNVSHRVILQNPF